MCDALDSVARGELKRLMVFMPPGSAKTTYATVRFPAYYVGKYADKGVICASYSESLATMFGGKVRNLVKTPEFRELFDVSLTEDTRAKGEWTTDAGGFYFAAGVGSGVTGRRGDIIILDDPIKGREAADSELIRDKTWEWFKADLRSRGKPGYAIIIVMTRWHEDDPAGRLLPDDWNGESGTFTDKFGEEWMVLSLPAEARSNDLMGRKPGEYLWTDYFPPEHWRQTKVMQGPRNWTSLYQQTPTAEDGTEFRREWMRYYTRLPEQLNTYMSGDFATQDDDGDFTEIPVWGICPRGDIYVLDWKFGQKNSSIWIEWILDLADMYNPNWLIGEGGQIRRMVEPFLKKRMMERGVYVATQYISTGENKLANASTFQGLCASGRVYWPYKDWAERAINELLKFPSGKHDDAVDACSLFGMFYNRTWTPQEPVPVAPPDLTAQPTMGEIFQVDRDDF